MPEPTVPPPLPVGDGEPWVAVPFDDTATPEGLAGAVAAGMDIAEVRVDRFVDPGGLAGPLARFAALPTILTVRSAREGGAWAGDENVRLGVYREALDHVGTVDVELGASICADVVTAARPRRRTVIGSFHDFDHTPDRAALEAIVASGDELGVDLVKVATMVRSPADVRTLCDLLLTHHARGLIVVGMGPTGVATRVTFPFLGSRLTFAAHGGPTAPGQLGLHELAATLRPLSAGYAARHPAPADRAHPATDPAGP